MYRTQTMMEDTLGTNMEQYSLPVHYLYLPKPEISNEKLQEVSVKGKSKDVASLGTKM